VHRCIFSAWIMTALFAGCASDPDSASWESPTTETSADPVETVRMSDTEHSQPAPTETEIAQEVDTLTHADLPIATDSRLPGNTPLSLLQAAFSGFQAQKASDLEIDARTGECMRSKGFDYYPLVSKHTYYASDYSTIEQQLEHANQYGYGIFFGHTENGIRQHRELFALFDEADLPDVDTDDEDYLMALIGKPDLSLEEVTVSPTMPLDRLGDGCLSRAVMSFREDQALPELSDALRRDLYGIDFGTVGSFQQSIDAYISCMADAGIEVDDLSTSYLQFENAYVDIYVTGEGLQSTEDAQAEFERERVAAIADVECHWQHTLAARLQLEYDHLLGLAESYPEIARFLLVVEDIFA